MRVVRQRLEREWAAGAAIYVDVCLRKRTVDYSLEWRQRDIVGQVFGTWI